MGAACASDEDFDILEGSVAALLGIVETDSKERVRALIYGSRSRAGVVDASGARESINKLCDRYGVPRVFGEGESASDTARDLMLQAAENLMK